MRQFLTVLAACFAVALISAAVLWLGFGTLSLAQGDRSILIGTLIGAVVLLVPGLLLYRFSWRSLTDRRRPILHLALSVCVVGYAILLGKWQLSGYFDPKVVLNDGVLEINGPLDRETLQLFWELLETEDLADVRVRVRSPGGDTKVGMAIGREIHRLRLDVEVDQQCASSCANYLFTAGNNKYVDSVENVRFHGGSLQPNFVQAALDMLQAGTQLDIYDPKEMPDSINESQLRALYGLREDFPFNPAGSILAERAFFNEIGVSQLTPVYGQYGQFEPWFDDGIHDWYFYTIEDFRLLGVSNVHVVDSEFNGKQESDAELFRAKISVEAMEALATEMDVLTRKIEDSMPFNLEQIWIRNR